MLLYAYRALRSRGLVFYRHISVLELTMVGRSSEYQKTRAERSGEASRGCGPDKPGLPCRSTLLSPFSSASYDRSAPSAPAVPPLHCMNLVQYWTRNHRERRETEVILPMSTSCTRLEIISYERRYSGNYAMFLTSL